MSLRLASSYRPGAGSGAGATCFPCRSCRGLRQARTDGFKLRMYPGTGESISHVMRQTGLLLSSTSTAQWKQGEEFRLPGLRTCGWRSLRSGHA